KIANPNSPMMAKLARLSHATRIGGCGFWNGFRTAFTPRPSRDGTADNEWSAQRSVWTEMKLREPETVHTQSIGDFRQPHGAGAPAEWPFALDADTDDPFRVDAEHRRVETGSDRLAACRQDLRLTADFDHPRSPGINCRQVVNDDCHARVMPHVAVFLAFR